MEKWCPNFGKLAAGTLNSDEARDLDLPLKERFFLQPLPPAAAAQRAKESAREIVGVKELIDKKAWPYVQNDLRLKASYLRYDLNTIISSKPKEEKKPLKELTGKLFQDIDKVSNLSLPLSIFFGYIMLITYVHNACRTKNQLSQALFLAGFVNCFC